MNAKTELLDVLKDKAKIKCAILTYSNPFSDELIGFNLHVNHSDNDLSQFWDYLDFEYIPDRYSNIQISGTIWLECGSWIERIKSEDSYDEWWEINKCPVIPEGLM